MDVTERWSGVFVHRVFPGGIFSAILLLASCVHSSGPLPVRNEEGPIPPHIANQQATPSSRAGSFPPWIADAKPGILAPTEDFTTGETYGLVHGLGFSVGSRKFVAEQWLLSKESAAAPSSGVKQAKFPDFLPLVEQIVAHRDKLVWGLGRYPYGNPAPSMGFQDFYGWAVSVLAPEKKSVAYGLGVSSVLRGVPPDHLDAGLGSRAMDLDTEGYAETFSASHGCRFTVFAAGRWEPFTNTTQEPFLGRFERSRRMVQAYDLRTCSNDRAAGSTPSVAVTTDTPHKTYREWLEAIKAWDDADVSYLDGTILLDDDFKGETMSVKDVKDLAPLSAPKK